MNAWKRILTALLAIAVILTAVFTGLFCHLVLRMKLLEGLLLGSVLGSTDAASVFSILRSRKLNLKYGSASMLELESGSNDPFAYMMTMIVLSAMSGTAGISVPDAGPSSPGGGHCSVFNLCGPSGGGGTSSGAVSAAGGAVSGAFVGGAARCSVHCICYHGGSQRQLYKV